ncbi:MAG: cysteine desulfurase family protein [Nannocystaceae bacterium]
MINLDHNATTPLDPRVRTAMVDHLARSDHFGNASSVHRSGREARRILESARRKVAAAVGAEALGVTFTAGGSEADTLAIVGVCTALRAAGRPCGVLTSRLEHAAVTASARRLECAGHRVVFVEADRAGRIEFAAVVCALERYGDIGLVSLASANHELGNAYDIQDLVGRVRATRHEVWVHTDAVQAFGKVELNFAGWDVDLMSLSAHKIGGPSGVGALIHRREVDLTPQVCGGGQERGRRPGTENLLGIHGFGVAAELAGTQWHARRAHMDLLRDRLRVGLADRFPDQVVFVGDPEAHVGNTVCAMFPGCSGEMLMINLDLSGIAVSTGSACTVGRVEPSSTMLAMGYDETAARAVLRFSVGVGNCVEDIDRLLEALPGIVRRVREAGSEGRPA